MEPTPERIEFAGEFVEMIPGMGPAHLFRVVVNVKKLTEHHGIDIDKHGPIDFHHVAQAAHEERDAFAVTGHEKFALPLSRSGIEPVVVDVNHGQFTWMIP